MPGMPGWFETKSPDLGPTNRFRKMSFGSLCRWPETEEERGWRARVGPKTRRGCRVLPAVKKWGEVRFGRLYAVWRPYWLATKSIEHARCFYLQQKAMVIGDDAGAQVLGSGVYGREST